MYAHLVSQTYFIYGQLGRNVLVLDSCISFKIKANNMSLQIIWHLYPSVSLCPHALPTPRFLTYVFKNTNTCVVKRLKCP